MSSLNVINQSQDTVICNSSCSQPPPQNEREDIYWTISDDTEDFSSRDEDASRIVKGTQTCGKTVKTTTKEYDLQTGSCCSICPSAMTQIKSKGVIATLCTPNVLTGENSADTSFGTLCFSNKKGRQKNAVSDESRIVYSFQTSVDQQSNKRNTKCAEKNRKDDRTTKRANLENK